jgi:outer membrane protein assembly factor BamB
LTAFEEKSLVTIALDSTTGRELWKQSLARERKGRLNNLNNAASPSPAADADGIVVFFQDFGLAAYSASGERQWLLPLPPPGNMHGMGGSPILSSGLVLLVVGGERGSTVMAFERKTGKQRWTAPLTGVTYSTPVITHGAGASANVVVLSTGEVVAYRLPDGLKVWWLSQVPFQPKSSPIVSADGKSVFLSVQSLSDHGGRPLLGTFEQLLEQYDVNGDGKLTLEEFKARNGPVGAFPQIDFNGDGVFTREEHEQVLKIAAVPHLMAAVPADLRGDVTDKLKWVYRKSVPNVTSPLLYDGVFYAIKEGGIAVSINPADGEVWKEGRIAPGFGAMFASPVAGDGKIYAISQAGKIVVLKAGRNWETLAVNELDEECFATPALSGDRIYVRSQNHLWCFRDSGG